MRRTIQWDAVERDGDTWKFYHRTSRGGAAAIPGHGFVDATRLIGGMKFTGVWLSNYPLDANEGAKGSTLFRVLFTVDVERLADWEVVNEGCTYREWCVPAAVLNEDAKVVEIDDDDDDLPEVQFPAEWLE